MNDREREEAKREGALEERAEFVKLMELFLEYLKVRGPMYATAQERENVRYACDVILPNLINQTKAREARENAMRKPVWEK